MRGCLVGLIGCLSLVLALAGCEDDPVVQVGAPPVAPGKAAGAPGAAGAAETVVPLREYKDDDFVEVDVHNRNPFRSFATAFQIEAPTVVQRRVVMPDVTIDQMKLVAIVSGLPQPRAMLVDPTQVGHVVKRGDYVGRAEVLQAGGPEGLPVTLNWRVDRIRPNEVVLSREDPTAPNRPNLTRVLTLYEDEELARNF